MPLSTSNSSDRVPNLPHGKMWLVIFFMTAALCSGAELSWRALGYQPSIRDNPAWWAHSRRMFYDKSPNTVVLLGA